MPMQQTADHLAKSVGLFQGLEAHDVVKILSRGLTMRMSRGETVFYKGTTGNLMYVILSGKVAIMDGDSRVATLETGDMFGEMALISDDPRSATAVVDADAHLFVLNENTFHKLLTKKVSVQLLLNIVGTLATRLRRANKRLHEVERKA